MRDLITRSRVLLFATVLVGWAVSEGGMQTHATNNLAGGSTMEAQATADKITALPAAANPAAALSTEPNPLLAKWEGPYGGVPPFDRVQVALFKPALEAAMAENLAEVEKIANNAEAPTFENTIVALERAGQSLDRVGTLYNVWASTMNGPDFRVVEREMAPRLAAFSDKINQNEPLFKRIEAVYNSPTKKQLTSEQQRLVWLDYTNFVRFGAKLDAKSKARLSEINQQLAGLFTKFSQNVLAEEDGQFIVLQKMPTSRDCRNHCATQRPQQQRRRSRLAQGSSAILVLQSNHF